jgi:electron transport complex protein RnfA
MEFISNIIIYSLIAIFLENSIFTRALGTSSALLLIRKRFSLLLFGISLTLITTISSVICYFIYPFVQMIMPNYNLIPLVYVIVIGIVYMGLLVYFGKAYKDIAAKIKPMIHLASFNCAVLGALLLSTVDKLDLSEFIGFGIGTGVGFIFATYLISIAYSYLNSNKIPKSFRGFPITLLYIGIISLAFYGLIGHQLPF